MEGVFQKRLIFVVPFHATGESRSGLPFFCSAGDSARGGPLNSGRVGEATAKYQRLARPKRPKTKL